MTKREKRKNLAVLIRTLKTEQAILAETRDRLRTLISDAEELAEDNDEAVESLSEAIEALSRLQ